MSNQITINKSTVKIVGIVIAIILGIILLGFLAQKGYAKYSVSQCKGGKVVNYATAVDLYSFKEVQDNPKYLKCLEMLPEEAVGMAFLNIKDPNSDEGKLAFLKAVEGMKALENSINTGFTEGFSEAVNNPENAKLDEEKLNADVEAMNKQMLEDAEKIAYDDTDYSKPLKNNYKIPTTDGGFIEATNCGNPEMQTTSYEDGVARKSDVETCDDGTFVFTTEDAKGVTYLKLVTVNGDTYFSHSTS